MDPLEAALENAWSQHRTGHSEEALLRFKAIDAEHPRCVRSVLYQGAILWDLRRVQEAEGLILKSLDLNPRSVDAWNLYGLLCLHHKDLEGAKNAFLEALRLDSGHVAANTNLAVLLIKEQDPEAALTLLDRVIAGQPDFDAARLNRASALADLGRVEEAIGAYRALLASNPGLAKARYNLANLLLSTGKDWEEAWGLREDWWGAMEQPRRVVPFPEWDGSPFPGRTLLLHGAQEGFGDMVFFARYAALAKARGGRVILEAYPPLVSLLTSCPGVDEVIPFGAALPAVDFQAVLSSLPARFGTTLATVPCQVPYLSLPQPTAVTHRAELEARLAKASGRKVGLVWAGDRNLGYDSVRSIPPQQLAPLGASRETTYVLLQKWDPAAPPPLPPNGLSSVDVGDLLDDFAVTSHVLGRLEALISVDTSVAHVAGALGLPVLLLLPHQAEWRWLREREDSPWYPSFRLYRQASRGDWKSLLERVALELRSRPSPGAKAPGFVPG